MAARVGTPTGVSGLVEAVGSPSCATAVGLVLFWDEHKSKQPKSDGTGSLFVSNLIRRIRDLFAKISGE